MAGTLDVDTNRSLYIGARWPEHQVQIKSESLYRRSMAGTLSIDQIGVFIQALDGRNTRYISNRSLYIGARRPSNNEFTIDMSLKNRRLRAGSLDGPLRIDSVIGVYPHTTGILDVTDQQNAAYQSRIMQVCTDRQMGRSLEVYTTTNNPIVLILASSLEGTGCLDRL